MGNRTSGLGSIMLEYFVDVRSFLLESQSLRLDRPARAQIANSVDAKTLLKSEYLLNAVNVADAKLMLLNC